jgi:2-amino-4-hydroxy-6-hydroxymethyldihydropteridine diphosphokinase
MGNEGVLKLVALGANLSASGETLEKTLSQAIERMARAGFAIRAVSRFFKTPCFPVGVGPDYVNAAIAVTSPHSAMETLVQLHKIEAMFGRERLQRWGQRTLDLDLIGMDDSVLPNLAGFNKWYGLDPEMQAKAAPTELVLPHPRIQDRAFVLVPLADVTPDWVHPVINKSVRQMLMELPVSEITQVTPV